MLDVRSMNEDAKFDANVKFGEGTRNTQEIRDARR